MADDDAANRPARARWALALAVVVIGLLVFALVLWIVAGGLQDLGNRNEWTTALGSEDGMQNVAVITVGVATVLAGVLFLLLLSFQQQGSGDPSLVLMAAVGAALFMVDGVILVGIGWVAVPYIGGADFGNEHPFVKTVELLMVVRSNLGFLGGALIGVYVAADALRSLRQTGLPWKVVGIGVAAGILAVFGGALIIVGFGATVQTLGLIGSVAWSGSRSVLAARFATKGHERGD